MQCCTHTQSITANLARQGYRAFGPCYEARKPRGRKLASVTKPLFDNYLFIELAEDQRWMPINHTVGAKLMTRQSSQCEYHEPCIISNTFISRLMSCSYCDDKNAWVLSPGTRVRITHGPFAGFDAIVTSPSYS